MTEYPYIDIRGAIADHCRAMLRAGLTTGSGGNISVRPQESDHVCISPSGIPYEKLSSAQVAVVTLDGNIVDGAAPPSSECAMHRAVYEAREDVRAIVHTHSPYATTFACLRESIPASHYLVGYAGMQVPVASYATYGSDELARRAVEALGSDSGAVLLANHGLLAVSSSLERAFAVAEEIELVARIHYQARCIGTPVILGDEEMHRVIDKFKSYGVRPDDGEG